MAPVVFHLVSLKSVDDKDSFVFALKSLSSAERPLWAATPNHWISEPQLSASTLIGSGPQVQAWDYVVVFKSPTREIPELPAALQPLVALRWSITAEVQDEMIDNLSTRKAAMVAGTPPPLPDGWSAADHSGNDSAKAPTDVKISLETPSRAFGSDKSGTGTPMKEVIRDIGVNHPGPVAMLNFLSYLPNQRPKYLEFMGAFQVTVGPKYGGQPLLVGLGVSDWSSRAEEEAGGQVGEWEDAALLWYPEVWHFAKMLDDPMYTDLDRRHKTGVVRDNTVLCCTEVNLD